jgi:hypothetical protein
VVSSRDWTTPPKFEPLQYRLLDAVDGPYPFPGHTKQGAFYTPDTCSFPLETSTLCITGSTGITKTASGSIPNRATDNFAVVTWLDCSLIGSTDAELRARLLQGHQNNAQTVVERIFWTGGALPTSQHLAATTPITEVVGGSTTVLQTAATTITGTYDVVEAIGLLEEAMAGCYGGTPYIHVPRRATPHLVTNHLIKEKGSRLYTVGNNSVIVPAPGYPRSGPDGTLPSAGQAWFFATGSVKAWRSEVMFNSRIPAEYVGRGTNDVTLMAEQRFMFGWDCCHFAILVSLGGVITGSAGSAT